MAKTEKWESQLVLADSGDWKDIYTEEDRERVKTLATRTLRLKATAAGIADAEGLEPTEFTQAGKRVLRLKGTVDRAKPPERQA